MSETRKNKKNTAIAYGRMKQEDKGITIEQGNYGPSREEVNNLAGLEIKVEGYEIIFDEKTGKVFRVQDNRTLSEMNKDKYDRLLKEAARREKREETIEH